MTDVFGDDDHDQPFDLDGDLDSFFGGISIPEPASSVNLKNTASKAPTKEPQDTKGHPATPSSFGLDMLGSSAVLSGSMDILGAASDAVLPPFCTIYFVVVLFDLLHII
jgi:hypothetical protein